MHREQDRLSVGDSLSGRARACAATGVPGQSLELLLAARVTEHHVVSGPRRHRGQSLLAPASVEAMTTNHLTAPQRAGGEMILGRGRAWGYGMSVSAGTIPGLVTRLLRRPRRPL